MALEVSTYIDGLVSTNPVAGDDVSQADDHIRLLKSTVKATFPNLTGAVTAAQAELNILDGATLTTTELNYVDGVTSAIQTQLGTKAAGQGNWVQLGSTAISGTPSAVDFINGTGGVVIDSTYDEYMVTFSGVKPSTNNVHLWMRTTTDGVNFDVGTAYQYAGSGIHANGTSVAFNGTSAAQIVLTSFTVDGTAGGYGVSGFLVVWSPSAAASCRAHWELLYEEALVATLSTNARGVGRNTTAANVDGIRFLFSSGTMASGTIKLFGRKLT